MVESTLDLVETEIELFEMRQFGEILKISDIAMSDWEAFQLLVGGKQGGGLGEKELEPDIFEIELLLVLSFWIHNIEGLLDERDVSLSHLWRC